MSDPVPGVLAFRGSVRRRIVRLRAAVHEIRCVECRVSWRSWAKRCAAVLGGSHVG